MGEATAGKLNGNGNGTSFKLMVPLMGVMSAVVGVIASWVFALSRDQSVMTNRITANEVRVENVGNLCRRFDEQLEKVELKIDKVLDKLSAKP